MNKPLLLSLLLGILISVGSCKKPDTSAGEAQAATDQVSERVVNIRTQTVKTAVFEEKLMLTGEVEAWKKATVSSELSGKLQWLGLVEGNVVGQGSVVARINGQVLAAQRDQAQANFQLSKAQEAWQRRTQNKQVALAETNYGNSAVNFQRQQKLLQEQVVSKQAFDNAENALQNSRLQLDIQQVSRNSTAEINRLQSAAASASLRLAQVSLTKTAVTSPISGFINKVYVEAGEYINPGAPIADLVQISQVKVNAGVPERDIAKVKLGNLVNVSFDAYPDQIFTGPVIFIGAAADSANKTFPVKVRLSNPDLRLRPGMIAHVSLVKERIENTLVIPLDAVIEQEKGRIVFVEEKGKAQRREIETGPKSGAMVQVLKGLKAGENLVIFGQRSLIGGEKVRVTTGR
ncbi:MAG: efflux RND transporter periplasmic adaptor subunit [Candidatus Sericytochromatia bacterium]